MGGLDGGPGDAWARTTGRGEGGIGDDGGGRREGAGGGGGGHGVAGAAGGGDACLGRGTGRRNGGWRCVEEEKRRPPRTHRMRSKSRREVEVDDEEKGWKRRRSATVTTDDDEAAAGPGRDLTCEWGGVIRSAETIACQHAGKGGNASGCADGGGARFAAALSPLAPLPHGLDLLEDRYCSPWCQPMTPRQALAHRGHSPCLRRSPGPWRLHFRDQHSSP